MAPKLNEIVSSPQFQALTTDQKQATLSTYFEKVVAPTMGSLSTEQAKAVTDTYYAKAKDIVGQGQATEIREERPSEKFGRVAEPISQFAGMFAKSPIVGPAIAGAATGGTEIIKQGIQAIGSEPGTPHTFGESGKRIAQAFGRGAIGEALGRGVIGGAAALGAKMAPTAIKTGAQIMKTTAGIPEKTGEAVLRDPSRLGRAPSIKEAGGKYAEAMEATGLSQGPEAAMEMMGKSGLSEAGATDFAYNALQKLQKGELPYQEALVARDQIKTLLARPKWQNPNAAQAERFLVKMQQDLDAYLEPYFAEAGQSFQGARAGYREAKIAEDFGSWLPTNANKTASVLRGTYAASLGGLGYGGAIDPETAAAGMALASPRMLGYGIRGAAVAAPLVKEAAKFGTRLGTQSIAGKVLPSSTEELMRKHYEAQK